MGLQRRWSTLFGCSLILAERESRICSFVYSNGLFLISFGTIAWNMHDGEPTTCIKFINLQKKSRQSLRQQIFRKALFNSIRPRSQTVKAWVRWYKVMWWIRNHKLSIGPQWIGHILWLSIPSCQWSYNRLCSWTILWLQHPMTTKRLRVELNVIHIMRARALYLQFCWDLVPSKLTPHRHKRLLQIRRWSYR